MKLKSLFACACLLACLLTGRAQADVAISVGTNVRVSAANAQRSHYETYVAADPANAQNLIACSIIEPKTGPSEDGYNTIAYRSHDGGATWQPALEVDDGVAGSGDPSCTFGTNSAAYFVTIVNTADANAISEAYRDHMHFYRSSDAGKTWSAPILFPMDDRDYIVADNSSSKFRGRIYINANGFLRSADTGDTPHGGLLSYHSADGGLTFSAPTYLMSKPDRSPRDQANGVVLSNGTYVVVYGDELNDAKPGRVGTHFKALVSTDGGESFARAHDVVDAYDGGPHSAGTLPTAAVDLSDGPFRDRIYFAWSDVRNGRSQALLTYSSDKGKTWSLPTIISDDWAWPDGSGPDGFMPMVAVNRHGVVGVTWYDRRDNRDNFGYYARFAASLDGGETFLPSLRVSEAPTSYDPHRGIRLTVSSRGGNHVDETFRGGNITGALDLDAWMGHTASMTAAADGTFHPVWVDNRTGPQQLWTTSISVAASAAKNGAPELAMLTDVTNDVELRLSRATFSRSSNDVIVQARVRNRSRHWIGGPLKLRIVSIDSGMGDATITNADNGFAGRGCVFDLSPNGNVGAGLAPGASTNPRVLRFHLSNVRPLKTPTVNHIGQPYVSAYSPSFVKFDARFLAGSSR